MSDSTSGATAATPQFDTASLDTMNAAYKAAQEFEVALTVAKLKGDTAVDAAKQRPQV